MPKRTRLSPFLTFVFAFLVTDIALGAPKLRIGDLEGTWNLVTTTKYNLAGFGGGKGSSTYTCELTASGADSGDLICDSENAFGLALSVTLSKNGKKLRWSSDDLEADPGYSSDFGTLVEAKDTDGSYADISYEENSHKYVNFKASRKALKGGSYWVNGQGTGVREVVVNAGSENETTREVEYAKPFFYRVNFTFSRPAVAR